MPKQVLDQEDFFKLLTTQLTNQDPMSPMEDTAFIAQMANFSSLTLMRDLSNNFANFQAQTMIGFEVLVNVPGQEPRVGMVTGLDFLGKEPRLIIDGEPHLLEHVSSVRIPGKIEPAPEVPAGD